MKIDAKLVTRVALVSGVMGLAASCTSAKIYAVVPEQKPSPEEIAQLKALQETDTTTVETTALQFQPVDLASDKTVAMAYAIPEQRPDSGGIQAIASLDNSAAATAVQPVQVNAAQPEATQPGAAVETAAVMQDGFGTPDYTASSAYIQSTSVTQSDEPFVTSQKNTNLNQLISKYAALYEVPEDLVHHVVRRESNYNPGAVHRGNWGLMQIRYNTARGLGYLGSPKGLLDAETNLKYAVKYLKGAWLVADRDSKKADWLYRTGYYYQAKAKDMLDITQ